MIYYQNSAFPYQMQGETTEREASYGMELRDYFAAKALCGLLVQNGESERFLPSDYAGWAYDCADAMMEARKKWRSE